MDPKNKSILKWIGIFAVIAMISGCSYGFAATAPVQDVQPNTSTTHSYSYLLKESTLSDSLSESLHEVLKNADSYLLIAPPSVTQKKVLPPGATAHDFVSLSIYAWPDPQKPNGLPYILKDGFRNPDVDDGSKYDEASLMRMIDYVETLAMAYDITKNEKYAQKAAEILRVWFIDPETIMNPNLTFAQCVPGASSGESYGIITTCELTRVVDSIALLENSPSWTSNHSTGVKDWFNAYVLWLQTSEKGIEESNTLNNHAVWYDAQVASFAYYTGNTDLSKKILEDSKLKRIATQIEPFGGMPREMKRVKPISYILYNLRAFVKLAEIGDKTGVDLWNYSTGDGRSIRKAFDYILPYLSNEKSLESFYTKVSEYQMAFEGEVYFETESVPGDSYFAHYMATAYIHYHDPTYERFALKLLMPIADTENIFTDEILRKAVPQ